MIELLRHGQTQSGSGFFGKTDVPLSALGWQQMREAVDGRCWQQIVSSPKQRCLAFAQELAQTLSVPLCVENDLQELDFGDWEGLTPAQVMTQSPKALAQFWQDPYGFTVPNAEPMLEFDRRVTHAVAALESRFAGQQVLLITHAGVMRLLLARARGLARERLLEVEVAHASLHPLLTVHN